MASRMSRRQSGSSSTRRMVMGPSAGSTDFFRFATIRFSLVLPFPLRRRRLGLRRVSDYRARRRHILTVEREAERAALAQLALHPDCAVVGLDNALHARQPDALPRHVARRGILSSA